MPTPPTATDNDIRNPAGRLLMIIRRAMAEESTGSGRAAWAPILQIPKAASESTFLNRMAMVLRIPGQIERAALRFKLAPRKLYIDPWRRSFIAASPYINLTSSLRNFTEEITAECTTALGLLSHVLNDAGMEPQIDLEELAKIQGCIAQLMEVIESSADLDPSLCDYLIRHLFFIYEAIDEYATAGVVPVQRSINATIGTILTDPDAKEYLETPFGKRCWDAVKRTASVANVARAGCFLLEKGPDLFLPGS